MNSVYREIKRRQQYQIRRGTRDCLQIPLGTSENFNESVDAQGTKTSKLD